MEFVPFQKITTPLFYISSNTFIGGLPNTFYGLFHYLGLKIYLGLPNTYLWFLSTIPWLFLDYLSTYIFMRLIS